MKQKNNVVYHESTHFLVKVGRTCLPDGRKFTPTLNFLAIHIRVQSRRLVLSPFMFRRVGKEGSLTLLRFRFIADQLMCLG